MASDRASSTDTVMGTAASSSDTESSETLTFKTITTEQVDEISGDEKPIVNLPPRPSTAPPAIQTPTMPSEPLLNDITPNQAVAVAVEPEVEGVKKGGNEILLDETIALTNLRPTYPVSRRTLQESVYPNRVPAVILKSS